MRKNLFLSLLAIFILANVDGNAQIIELQGIRCPGDFTGRLGVTTDFGVEPYTYVWSNGETSNIISGLGSGIYSVSVTDALLVSQVFNYNLNDPAPITTTYSMTDNSFWPNSNGTISVTANGGVGWYTYHLQDSTSQKYINQAGPFFSNLCSGTYYLETLDLNGCQKRDTVKVDESSGIIPDDFSIDYTACYESTAPISVEPGAVQVPALIIIGEDTTTIIKIVPGLRPYINSLNDTLSAISGSVWPGRNNFKIITADNKGFRYSWLVDSVITPIKITWTQRNLLCYGDDDGRIIALAEGSYGDFTYRITGPNSFSSNNSSVNNLVAGEYIITATDSTGCRVNQSVAIKSPDSPIQGDFYSKNLSCFQSSDGEIVANFKGGTGDLSYLWSPNGQTNPVISNISAGIYSLRVRDENGCTLNPSAITITQPEILRVNDLIVPLSCYGYDDASITVTPVGGNGGSIFTWKKNGVLLPYNGDNIGNLSNGVYSLELKDSMSCAFDTVWTINQPNNFQFKFINTPVSCNDELGVIRVHNMELFPLDISSNGFVQVATFDDTVSFPNLPSGVYPVIISNGMCNFDTLITFDQPLPLNLYISKTDNKCFDGDLGEVSIQVLGGTPGPNSTCFISGQDYRNSAVNIDFTDPAEYFLASNLKAGSYNVLVVDDDGCFANEKTIITQPAEPLRIHFETSTTFCPESEDGRAYVSYIENGLSPFSYLWSTGTTLYEIDSLEIGWYNLSVSDFNGCTSSDSIQVIGGNEVCIPNVITPNGDGYNDFLNIKNLCYHSNVRIIIMDESGRIIFENTDCNESWDGKDKDGNLLHSKTTVFAYIEQVKKDGSVKKFRKAITVLY